MRLEIVLNIAIMCIEGFRKSVLIEQGKEGNERFLQDTKEALKTLKQLKKIIK